MILLILPFTTIIVTFIYSAYFASGIVGNEAMGQVYWGNAVTICAIIIAILSPIMGADCRSRRIQKIFFTVLDLDLYHFFYFIIFSKIRGYL